MARSRPFQKILLQNEPEEKFEDRIDLLKSRAAILTGKDRLLMQMYLDNANTFRQMARLAGVNEANVARRIHKLTRRLLDGQYITCLRNRDKFTPLQMKIARDYFVRGLPMREIANRNDVSFYTVRQTMRSIQRLVNVRETADKSAKED
jgi:predicted DNA-binding protein YlxM (UPF0122 family)